MPPEDAKMAAFQQRVLDALQQMEVQHSLLLKRLSELQEGLDDALHGDGPPDYGLIVQMDRLRQAHAKAEHWLRVIGGAVIALILGGLAAVARELLR